MTTAPDGHTNRRNLMFNNDDRLKLWLSRFTPQEIDDILNYVHLLKLARANDSLIGGTDMKESDYYLRKVNYTIDYITQREIDTSTMVQS